MTVPYEVQVIADDPTDQVHKEIWRDSADSSSSSNDNPLRIGFKFLASMVNRLFFVLIAIGLIISFSTTMITTFVGYNANEIDLVEMLEGRAKRELLLNTEDLRSSTMLGKVNENLLWTSTNDTLSTDRTEVHCSKEGKSLKQLVQVHTGPSTNFHNSTYFQDLQHLSLICVKKTFRVLSFVQTVLCFTSLNIFQLSMTRITWRCSMLSETLFFVS